MFLSEAIRMLLVLTRFCFIILIGSGLSNSFNDGYYRSIVYPLPKNNDIHINDYTYADLIQRPLRKQYGYNEYCIGLNRNVPESIIGDLHKVVETITSKSLDTRMQFDTQKAWFLFSGKLKNLLDELNWMFHQNSMTHDVTVRSTGCFRRDFCPLKYSPVCGSDGRTYTNECAFESETCSRNSYHILLHHGECKDKQWTSEELKEKGHETRIMLFK